MNTLLAVDIGGTKTLLQLSSLQGEVIVEQKYDSQQYDSFDLLLAEFLAQEEIKQHTIVSACFGVAGPVVGKQAVVTNLPWVLDADELRQKFSIKHVHLCNDFEAVGYGIAGLKDDEIDVLQEGEPDLSSPRAVIGAGTGLGQALMFPEGGAWKVVATEGGNVDFAPTDQKQILLLEHMMQRFGHVSYERIVSGVGLVTIYDFLRSYQQRDEDPDLRQAMIDGDPAAAISQFALKQGNELAIEALDMFITIYGAQAGNLALSVIPMAGLYIAGGIAAKNIERFQEAGFLDAFRAKGKMQHLVEKIPVYVILQPKVGLLGARLLAQQSVV
ncbi:MAG: glucokinase [Gammaproteobacteria bacterium]|nr:MAG: glucokinase [Gammaproteobacteria bacterium]